MVVLKEPIPTTTQKGTVCIQDKLKIFNKNEPFGVLATDDNGTPYTSLVTYALTPDLKRVLFITPKNTSKYRNILHSAQVALLVDNRTQSKQNLFETEVITVIGTAKPVKKGRLWNELAKVFLTKHPEFELFLASSDTALVAVDILRCIHVSHFQTISVWESDS
jgi:heme iron utilization protein